MSGEITEIRLLAASFARRSALQAALDDCRGPAGELAFPTRATPQPGEAVVVEVACPGLPNRVCLRGRAGERDGQGRLRVRFEPDQRMKCDFLAAFAAGDAAAVIPRRNQRFCVYLPVLWLRSDADEPLLGVVEDLSAGGLHMRTCEPIAVRTELLVRVRLGQTGPVQELVLSGTVLGCCRVEPQRFQVRLRFSNNARPALRALRQILRTFAERGLVYAGPAAAS
jgi:hypothetical protein